MALMRRVKGKQMVLRMMFRVALSPEFRTTIIEQFILYESRRVSPGTHAALDRILESARMGTWDREAMPVFGTVKSSEVCNVKNW